MIKLLSPLAEQKFGYSFGNPIRVDEKSLAVVLPILRTTSLNRQYITFPETEKVIVFDTGKIDEMDAENQTDQNVFVRSGTLFRGATQERALMRSAVLFPGKKQKLGVRCVHASRGINPSSKVSYGGITPLDFDASNYSAGFSPKSQADYWHNVHSSTKMMNSMMGKNPSKMGAMGDIHSAQSAMRRHRHQAMWMSSAAGFEGAAMPEIHDSLSHDGAFNKGDDLHSTFAEFSMHFDEVLSKVKIVENQAGVALITQSGVETIEFFDHRDSWKALHDAAVKRLGSNIVGKDSESVFEYKPENAVKQVNRVLALDWKLNRIFKHRPNNGEPEVEITGLTADGFVGEAVEANGSLIHLTILKQK